MNTTVTDFKERNVVYIYLGERDWSTIPKDVPIDKWLYDKAWMRSYCSRLSTTKRRIRTWFEFADKKVPMLPAVAVSVILLGCSIYVQNRVNTTSMVELVKAERVQKVLPIEPIKDLPVSSVKADAINSEAAVQKIDRSILVDRHEPIENNVIEDRIQIENFRHLGTTSTNTDKGEKVPSAEKPPRGADLKQKTREALANTGLPLPIQTKAEIKPQLQPPLPKFIGSVKSKVEKPQGALEKKSDDLGKKKSWMAIEDSGEESKASLTNLTAPMNPNNRVDEPKSKPVVSQMESNQEQDSIVLQDYKIVTLTKNSVVISDPKTRAHKQVFVGSKLPGGETVKAVNEDSGVVTTEIRILKMK